MRSVAGLIAIALVASVVACSGSADDPTGRTWQLMNLEGVPRIQGSVIDMTIADGQVSGTSGCNTYNGPATVDEGDNSMTLGPDLASTMMACSDEVMEQELRYLTGLPRVASYEMANDTLTLLDGEGVAVAEFE
jgi:heat shock protein HslJ